MTMQMIVTNQKTKSIRPASREAGVGIQGRSTATAVAIPPAITAIPIKATTEPLRIRCEPSRNDDGRQVLLGGGELDAEGRPASAVRDHPDPAVHAMHELATDVEPEPGASDPPGQVRVEPVELLEDAAVLRA